MESLACTATRFASPMLLSKSRIASSIPCGSARRYPAANACWVSRHTLTLELSASSINRPISSNDAPRCDPIPALFSRMRYASSGVLAITSASAAAAASFTASNPADLWLPQWKITPTAPSWDAAPMWFTSESIDLRSRSGPAAMLTR